MGREKYGRSDTLMLIHVDPGGNYVSVLSLPRDLRLELGSHGYQKINAAYAFGGDTLAITTVQALTGLKVNHFVNVGLEAFRSITTALGGIYVDVDRRYYSTAYGYEPIDTQPGYQRLAGEQALTFVRWRHDDNLDYGRIDRQQLFLRAAKEQAMRWSMATKIPSVVSLLAQHVTTDLSTLDAIRLSWWGVKLGMGRVKQVKLATTDGYIDGVAYVFATPEAVQTAVNELLQPPGDTGPSTSTTPVTMGTTSTSGTSGVTPGQANLGSRVLDLKDVSVEVYNASGKPAAAAAATRVLQRLGAHILMTREAPQIATSVVFAPAWTTADGMNDPSDAAMVGQALGVFTQGGGQLPPAHPGVPGVGLCGAGRERPAAYLRRRANGPVALAGGEDVLPAAGPPVPPSRLHLCGHPDVRHRDRPRFQTGAEGHVPFGTARPVLRPDGDNVRGRTGRLRRRRVETGEYGLHHCGDGSWCRSHLVEEGRDAVLGFEHVGQPPLEERAARRRDVDDDRAVARFA
ncbi:MAG: LCP family protein [Actinobacteria bacterium]|nr:LCP family protein [Actinomycetota bacterium]